MKTEVEQLATCLVAQGVVASWIDSQGNTQPAPKLQTRWLDETLAQGNERLLFIRNVSAGTGDRFTSTPAVSISCMGKTAGDAAVFVEEYAKIIYDKLLEFTNGDGIVAIEPLGRIGGPYKMESGRFVYDMEFSVIMETGYILRGMK